MEKKILHDHPNCIFAELEQTFCKCYKMKKIEEYINLKLWSIKHEEKECVEFYYEWILKLANCL
jgi:hypothetical protein